MRRLISNIGFAVAPLLHCLSGYAAKKPVLDPVRVAVLGGMTGIPFWNEIQINKIDPDPGVKIMVQGDPNMRRPCVAMVANPKRFSLADFEGANELSSFSLLDKIQNFLATYDGGVDDGVSIFIPL